MTINTNLFSAPPGPEELPKRRLGDWLKSYMAYTSPLEAPDDFHFWTGVSTIAGALRRRFVFRELLEAQARPAKSRA